MAAVQPSSSSWSSSPALRYEAGQGLLRLSEEPYAASPEHFTVQLDLLEKMAGANRGLNPA